MSSGWFDIGKRLVIASVLLCLAPPLAAAATPTDTLSLDMWSAVSDTLRAVESGRRATLRYAFVSSGSDTVRVNGTVLARDVYRLDYQMGTLRIDTPLPPGAVVVVTYRREPLLLKPVYTLRPMQFADPALPEPPPERMAQPATKSRDPTRNLIFGGSKSVSFSVGNNRGSSLDQTLQASIEGQITPTIRVRALLSDKNLPIQAEGNTEELEYFDQVFVEIEGSNARATLGDFSLRRDVSTFSPMTRELKGIDVAAWKKGSGRVSAAGATSKGVYRTAEFRGRTGLQGPYELLSAARTTGEVIIAGTERVYIDGTVLRRGQNQDYVIDYDAGTVTFTPRRLITRDSEIAVDYEVTQQQYDRSVVLAAAEEVAIGFGTQLAVSYVAEGDDRDRPKNLSLGEEDKRALEIAGDDPALAVTSGVTQVDPGKGEYVLLPADTSLSLPDRFAFSDSIGNYLVAFIETDASSGDYALGGISRSGRRFFAYVGAGRGVYRVGRRLPVPEHSSVLTTRVARKEKRRLTYDLEWNISDYDRNLFSSDDDGDNIGHAGRVQLALGDLRAGPGRLGVGATWSLLEARFKSFDRVRPQYYYRDWNLEDIALTGTETSLESDASYKLGRSASVRYAFGSIRRDDLTSDKHEGNLIAGDIADRGVRVRAFDTGTDGPGVERTRTRITAEGSFGVWRVVPTLVVDDERFLASSASTSDSGYAYRLVRGRVANRHPGGLVLQMEAQRRETEEAGSFAASWQRTRTEKMVAGTIASRQMRAFQGELQVTHHEEENHRFATTTKTDLARVKTTIRSDRTGVRADIDYEISQAAARTLERSIVFVGEGKGDYNQQGDVVGKGKGAYIVVFFPTENVQPVHRVGLNSRLVWTPPSQAVPGSGAWDWIVRNVSLDQTIGVQEEATAEPAWKTYVLAPSALQQNGSTVFGTTSIRQDWSLLRAARNVSLVFRYQRQDTEDNRFQGIREDRFFGEHAARLSRSLSQRLTATGEVGRSRTARGGAGLPIGSGSVYEVVGVSVLGGVGLRFNAGSSADVDVKHTTSNDDVSQASQTVLSVQPRAVWRVDQRVNVFASYELARATGVDDNIARPVIFASAGDSHRWNGTVNIRMAKVLSVLATYAGRRETTFTGARITDHELRLETRAFF